jgi:hypothetical protein
MSNEEREYQASNLPLPTDEEYEEDEKVEQQIRNEAILKLQDSEITFQQYIKICQDNFIMPF